MTIRTRLLVVAAVPAVALALTTFLLRSGAPASKATIATALAAAGCVAAIVLAIAVARTITAPLAQLGEAAERASHLQTLVEALRRPGAGDKGLALAPVGLPPGGEIGRVAQTFDEFQGAAARLAIGQAALLNKTVADKGTVEVFVNLARRMQGLVDHQIEFLDGLEAEEQDPDTLENLFRLDQLATRVRRNAESLLTLAGAASARSWERPLAMSDVIRAGMAEVEDIARVDLLLDDNAAMLGNVAADAAHLLSELLENATRWSPPDTRVEVSGTPAAGGYAITIEDRGIGMAEDALAEANHILTGPPLAEATVARSLGLVVAGRLARRLGIVVRLAPSGAGGIIAKVLVPPTLMVAAEDTEGLEGVVAGSSRTLPFALARQEKRARISSQRSRGARPVPGSQPVEATITQLREPRWSEAPAAVEPAEPVRHESHWLDEPAPTAERRWAASEPESRWTDAAPVEPAVHAADEQWPTAEQTWSPDAAIEWPAADLSWPAAPAADEAHQEDWSMTAVADSIVAEPVPSEPELPVRSPSVAAEPAWPSAVAEEPDALATEPPAVVAGPPVLEPVVVTPPPPPVPQAARAPEPPQSIRPTPSVRPARFAASASRPLSGVAPQRTTVPSAEAKEDEYRRHLERATAAGLVRRVPKASLPQDTGGGAKRAPKTGGGEPVAERLPDEVRSLLSSYRSGVERGRADDPSPDQRTTTPQEQP